MPILSTAAHARPYVESPRTILRLEQIKLVLDSIRGLKIDLPIKKRMLVHGLWEVAKASGNFFGRYRSDEVTRTIGVRIERDHVYRKSVLVSELLHPSADIVLIMSRAVCCIVSSDEHRRLHSIDSRLDGWERYSAAGVVVHDMMSQETLTRPPSQLTGAAPGEAENKLRAGPPTNANGVLSNESDFVDYLSGRKSAQRYANFLHDVAKAAGRDINPQSLRTAADIESFASALTSKYGEKSVQNYKSVMNAYVRMVRDRSL